MKRYVVTYNTGKTMAGEGAVLFSTSAGLMTSRMTEWEKQCRARLLPSSRLAVREEVNTHICSCLSPDDPEVGVERGMSCPPTGRGPEESAE